MPDSKLRNEVKLANDLLWGLENIADFLGFRTAKGDPDIQAAHYKLSKGQLPAKQIGTVWVSSKTMLQEAILADMKDEQARRAKQAAEKLSAVS